MAAKSPTTPKQAGAIADQGNPWESGGSRKADLGDFRPSKSDGGRRHSCLLRARVPPAAPSGAQSSACPGIAGDLPAFQARPGSRVPAWFSWHESGTSSPENLRNIVSRGNSCPNSCQFGAVLRPFYAIWLPKQATKKPCKSLIYRALKLVAGVGFEPTTFRL